MDFSELQTYQDCPQKSYLKFEKCLRKIQEGPESLAPHFGEGIHQGLAQIYQNRGIERAKTAFLEAFPDNLSEDKVYTPENGVFALQEYEKWAKVNDREWEVIGVEVEDAFQVNGLEWRVKIDLIVKSNSGIWIVDHKTTQKRLDASFWGRFEMSAQMTGYCEYVKRKYGQCSGFWINGIGLHYREKPSLFDPESPDEMNKAQLYLVTELGYSKYYKKEMVYASGFNVRFERQNFDRLPQQIEAWKGDVGMWMAKLETSRATGTFPRNTSMCSWCEFKELCMSGGDEQIEGLMYEKCDPKSYLKGDEKDVT